MMFSISSALLERRGNYGFGFGLISCGAVMWLLLRGYTYVAENSPRAPYRNPAVLDAEARISALEQRRDQLLVTGFPYAPKSNVFQMPRHDEDHQRHMLARFTDEEAGLTFVVNTHLCFPGIDPCISGGEVEMSDGQSTWRMTFQFLGSDNPSRFHSSLPKSRKFIARMRKMAARWPDPKQSEFYRTLEAGLGAQGDSTELRIASKQLLGMLMSSFFSAEELRDTLNFAEAQGVLIPD